MITSYIGKQSSQISFNSFSYRNFRSPTSFGAWCSVDGDTDPWFHIDLLTTTNVSAVASQGVEIMGDGGHWVTQYSLNYSCDGVKWFPYMFQGGTVVSYNTVQYPTTLNLVDPNSPPTRNHSHFPLKCFFS